MTSLDIIKDVSLMLLLLTLLSIFIGIIFAVAIIIAFLPFRKVVAKYDEVALALVDIGTLSVILIFLFLFMEKWLLQITGSNVISGVANQLFILTIIGFLVLWVRKQGLLVAGNLIHSKLAKGNKVVLALIVMSGLVVSLNWIQFVDFKEIKQNRRSTPYVGMPNVILLSIDTLTAEDMSLYGYQLPTTPKLEAFSKESYVFDNYFSSSNWTTPSVASFISGLYPITSGVNHIYGYFREDDRKKNLGQTLKSNGYETAAIIANNYAHPLMLGISDSFSATTEVRMPGQSEIGSIFFRMKNYRIKWWLYSIKEQFKNLNLLSFALVQRQNNNNVDSGSSVFPPELVFDRALPFFNVLKKPVFVWAHIFPPHEPFMPAAPFKYRFEKSEAFTTLKDYEGYGTSYTLSQQPKIDQQHLRYDEFILDTDSRIGDFLDKLQAMGRFEDSIIIVTADHGESFTRNYLYHGGPNLHQPLIHIPLIIHLPGQKAGAHISDYAGQVDLLPTVVDLLKLPIPNWVEGESLKPVMLEGKATTQPKYSMNLFTDSSFLPPTKGTFAVMQDGWKFVRYLATDKEELYHLAIDPKEDYDLAGSNPEKAKQMRELIYARYKLGK